MADKIEFRDIEGYPAYRASSDGKIYRVGRDRPLAVTLDRKGYELVALSNGGKKKRFRLSRLVCTAFHGPAAPGMHAAHLNSSKRDNRAENLAWKTPKENDADKVVAGTTNRGERNGRAKLTRQQVAEIRASNEPHKVLAERYGLYFDYIGDIKAGVNWK